MTLCIEIDRVIMLKVDVTDLVGVTMTLPLRLTLACASTYIFLIGSPSIQQRVVRICLIGHWLNLSRMYTCIQVYMLLLSPYHVTPSAFVLSKLLQF
jgi:hypothetical protein